MDLDPYGAQLTGIQFHTCDTNTEEQQQPNSYLPLENVIKCFHWVFLEERRARGVAMILILQLMSL